jgi:catechol 2,3-dioxygenase-like lactoylglutathione lyase family enzyme
LTDPPAPPWPAIVHGSAGHTRPGIPWRSIMMLKEKLLLKDKPSSAIVAVSNLDRAREFYTEMLGLEPEGEGGEDMLTLRTGDTRLTVYKSEFAGTNKANAVTWNAGDDFDEIAGQLRERGVRFEEYPDLGMDISNGIHRSGEFKGVWFKDPDGNILHIGNM